MPNGPMPNTHRERISKSLNNSSEVHRFRVERDMLRLTDLYDKEYKIAYRLHLEFRRVGCHSKF